MDHLATSGGGLVATSGGGVPRSGTYALRAATSGTQRWSEWGGWSATGRPDNLGLTSQVYAGFYYKPAASHPNGSCIIASARDSAGNIICQVLTDASGNITLQGTGAASGTIATVSTGSYAQFLMRVNSNGTCGLSVAGGAETTVTGGNFTFDRLRLGIQTTSITADSYWDDGYLSTDRMTGWVARIAAARAAGSGTAWNTGSGNTFAVVDEIPHNSDTDYLLSANGVGSNSPRSFLATTTTTLGITDPIIGVLAVAVVREDGASSNSYRTVVTDGAGTTIASCTAADIGTTSYIPVGFLMDLDPDTGAAWTYGGFDATEFGVEKSGSSTGALRCTAIYGVVLSGVISTSQNVSPTGIASAESMGTQSITLSVAPSGIATGESLGSHSITLAVAPSGIASLEDLGTHAITAGAVNISPTGIDSLEDLGAHTVIAVQIVTMTGIASLEDMGAHAITAGAVNISPTGIATGEALGAHSIAMLINPSGIVSLEALGLFSITAYVPMSGIASAESLGTHQVNLNVKPSGIASLEALGTQQAKNVVNLFPAGIASLEALGTHLIRAHISPTGIVSLEALGTFAIIRVISPTGIASLEALGALSITAGSVTISPTGIGSGESLGAHTILFAITGGKLPPPGVSTYSYGPPAGVSFRKLVLPAGGSSTPLWLPPGVSR